MSYNNENTMTTASTFILPAMMDSGFDREDLGDDFEGLQLSFKKFKIPGGGMTQFEEPGDDPENPEYVRNIEGIIVYNHASNASGQPAPSTMTAPCLCARPLTARAASVLRAAPARCVP